MTTRTPAEPMTAARMGDERTYMWMWPAIALGRLRPPLKAATTADAARLRELPAWLARVVLPLAAVGLPLALSVLHALRPVFDYGTVYADPAPWTFLIWTTFTESISFVVLAAVIGMVTPAAGVLVVLVYAATDLPAAFVTREMLQFPGAVIGRFSSYLLLWLLAVEIPLLSRAMVEMVARADDAPRSRRVAAVLLAGPVTAGLVYIWVEAARQLIGAVHYLSNLTVPAGVYTHLFETGVLVAVIGGAAAAVSLAVRYLGPRAHVSQGEGEGEASSSGGRAVLSYLAGAAVAMLLLVGYVDQAIDAVILIVAVFVARPIAVGVLRITRLAPLLIRIPWPVRLIAGFLVAFVAGSAYLTEVGISQVSRFGYMVIAIAGGLFLVQLFLAAEDAVDDARAGRARAVAESVAVGLLVLLAMPLLALADSGHQEATAIAGSAAAGAAAAAAAARNPYKNRPKEPGPEMPDFDKQQQQKQDDSFFSGFSKRFRNIASGFRKFFGG